MLSSVAVLRRPTAARILCRSSRDVPPSSKSMVFLVCIVDAVDTVVNLFLLCIHCGHLLVVVNSRDGVVLDS